MLRALFPGLALPAYIPPRLARSFAVTGLLRRDKPLPPRPKIVETDLEESFLKGSGPGGQKINKTSSAVQLKHLPTGIVVKSQETRSREQNRKRARDILAEKLDRLEKGDESRSAIKAERARVKKASASKKTRRKYKKLAEGNAVGVDDGEKSAADDDHGGGFSMDEHMGIENGSKASGQNPRP